MRETSILSHGEVSERPHIELSIVVPVHNEETIIEKSASELIWYVQKLGPSFEVLFVENGSTDKTPFIINRLEQRYTCIRSVRLKVADYSTALIKGIKVAKGRYSIVMGIDYTDLRVLDRCLHALKSCDLVICSKNIGADGRPFMNRFVNRCYNTFVRLIFGLKYSDVEGYHAYSTSGVQNIVAGIKTNAHLFNLWVLLKARKAGLRVKEVPLFVYEQRRSRFMRLKRLPYLTIISFIEFIKLKSRGF